MQSWAFNSDFWDKVRVQAFLSGVPIVNMQNLNDFSSSLLVT